MPCRVPKRRFSCGAPQHLTKNQNLSLTKTIRASLRTAFPSGTRLVFQKYLSRQHRGPTGINVWLGGGLGALGLKNASGFPGISGTPFTGSLGADYQTPCGLILGAVFLFFRVPEVQFEM